MTQIEFKLTLWLTSVAKISIEHLKLLKNSIDILKICQIVTKLKGRIRLFEAKFIF